MNFNRWALAITAVPTTLTSRFPTTGYARARKNGYRMFFQFTYCVDKPLPILTLNGVNAVCCICLLTVLTNVSVETNSVRLQEQADLGLHCLTKSSKYFQQTTFVVIGGLILYLIEAF